MRHLLLLHISAASEIIPNRYLLCGFWQRKKYHSVQNPENMMQS